MIRQYTFRESSPEEEGGITYRAIVRADGATEAECLARAQAALWAHFDAKPIEDDADIDPGLEGLALNRYAEVTSPGVPKCPMLDPTDDAYWRRMSDGSEWATNGHVLMRRTARTYPIAGGKWLPATQDWADLKWIVEAIDAACVELTEWQPVVRAKRDVRRAMYQGAPVDIDGTYFAWGPDTRFFFGAQRKPLVVRVANVVVGLVMPLRPLSEGE